MEQGPALGVLIPRLDRRKLVLVGASCSLLLLLLAEGKVFAGQARRELLVVESCWYALLHTRPEGPRLDPKVLQLLLSVISSLVQVLVELFPGWEVIRGPRLLLFLDKLLL